MKEAVDQIFNALNEVRYPMERYFSESDIGGTDDSEWIVWDACDGVVVNTKYDFDYGA